MTTTTDRLDIQDVRHRFGRALDTRDFALLKTLLAERVELDLSAFGVPAGIVDASGVVNVFAHAFRRPTAENQTQQVYSNFEVVIDGDRATSLSYLTGHHRLPGTPGGDEATLRATYDDRLVRTPFGWKLEKISLRVISISGNPAVLT